jgi:hypothetical protein
MAVPADDIDQPDISIEVVFSHLRSRLAAKIVNCSAKKWQPGAFC